MQERARAVRHSIAQRSTGILAAGPDDSLGQGGGPTRLSMPAPHSLEVHSPHPANKVVFYDQDVTNQVQSCVSRTGIWLPRALLF